MAVGFTTKERESITEALLRAAGRHAALSGMKKTSVDELCAEAGISKGAFYSFYPSKEHLFLTVMERWQEDKFYDRLGLDEQKMNILGVELPMVTIPVQPGRNLAVIVEVAAMNNRHKRYGFNSALKITQEIEAHNREHAQ